MKWYQDYSSIFKILSKGRVALVISACATSIIAATPADNALPTNPSIVNGQININTNQAKMTVNQASDKGIINWGSFNIGRDASVQFVQPNANASTLNRVVGGEMSQIMGNLSANGQVILINPNGVIFGAGSRADVGGLVASTMNLTDTNYQDGTYKFTRDGANGTITNQGNLSASKYIALLAPEVQNEGVVTAGTKGTVAFGAGESVTLDFAGDGLIGMSVDAATMDTLIANKNIVQTDGGIVIMSARALNAAYSSTVSNTGTISATSLQEIGGKIVLTADNIELKTGSTIEAKGAKGGGEVLVGGDWQGSGGVYQAKTVTMESGANIDVSATDNGNGGKVVLWSDVTNPNSITTASGTIMARGGANGGNGGQIETSGHTLNTDGIYVNAGADKGKGGLWLLDPADSTISQTVANSYLTTLNTGTSVTNAVTGDIAWSDSVTLNKTAGGDATLTLKATGQVLIGQNASISSTSNALNLVLWSSSDASLGSNDYVYINNYASISTNGGNLWIGGGSGSTTWNGLTVGNGYAYTTASNAYAGIALCQANISTGAGNIAMYGQGNGSGGKGIFNYGTTNITTTTGTIYISAVSSGFIGLATGYDNYNHAAALTIKSGSSSANAITINATGTTGTFAEGTTKIEATNGGGVTLTSHGSTYGIQTGQSSSSSTLYVLANSGAITLDAGSTGIYKSVSNGIFLGGAAGTDVTSSTSNIAVTSDSFSTEVYTPKTTGTLTVQPYSTSFSSAFSWTSSYWATPSTLSGLTLGKSGNTADITIASAASIAGAINVYGGNINLNANLTSTTSGSSILFKGSGNIIQAANTTVQTNGGNITYWADSDANGGYIYINDNSTIDSRTTAARSSSLTSTASGGGTITLGGGSTSSTLGDGTVVPTGYALQNATSGTLLAGILLGTYTSTNKNENIKFYSGGGDIVLRGNSTTGYNTGSYTETNGILSYEGLSIDAGTTGSVTLSGQAGAGMYATGIYLGYHLGVFSNTILRTANGNISMTGSATGGTNNRGMVIYSDATYNVTAEATGTGTVTLSSSGATQDAIFQGANILASSGAITITDTGAGTLYTSTGGGVTTIGYKSGSDVTSSTSNIVITDDSFSLASGAGLQVNTTGTLTVQSNSASFTSALTWSMTDFAAASGLTGLTLGKSGNTADITISSAQSIAGPINIYGGAVTLNAGLTTTNTTTGNIAITTSGLTGSSGITLASGRNLTVTQSGTSTYSGNITGTSATLTKAGSGTLTLAGTSSYSGGTTISSGILKLGSEIDKTPLGTGAVTVNSGTALDLAGYSLYNAINLSGTGVSSSGALYNSSGSANSSVMGAITLGADTLIKSAAGNLILDGATSGAYNLTITTTGGLVVDNSIGISGLLTLNVGTDFVMGLNAASSGISADGGFTKTGTGTSYLTGNITTQNHDISITGAVQVANFNGSTLTLGSNGGAIGLTGAISSWSGTKQTYSLLALGYTLNNATASAVTGSTTDVYVKYNAGNGVFITPNGVSSVQYLVVGGGGGGGTSIATSVTGGGGGGGGVADGTMVVTTGSSYGVTVGAGGGTSTSGSDTSFAGSILAGGGGAGANYNTGTGSAGRGGAGYTAGGSGGGNGYNTNNWAAGATGGAGSQRSGYSGGTYTYGTGWGGGGGGAGGNGSSNSTSANSGGAGYTATITGNSVAYGAGGSAGSNVPVANTGQGGGAQSYSTTTTGADGTVILRYGVSGASTSATSGLKLSSGAGAVSVGSTVSNLSSLEINAGSASTVTGVISGTGTLTQSGIGNLTLLGNGTYTGATTIASGSMLILQNNAPTTATSSFGGAGTLVIQPSSNDFTGAFSTSGWTFGSTLGGLTIGKSTSTDGTSDVAITVANAISIAGAISIYGGNIAINAALTATGTNTIMLKGSGTVTDGASGYLSASNLLLSGGAVTLDNASNAIGTLAASGVSSLTYKDSNALTIGTVGSTNGISATGAMSIGTLTGDLTVSQNISTTDTTASAIILNAGINTAAGTSTGGNIVISGTPTITAGSGGTIKLYSGSVSGSTGLTSLVGSGTGRFRYNSDETTTNYSTALATDVINAIYREAFSVSGTISSETITYGDANPSFTLTGGSGMQNGDSSSGLTIASAQYSTANKLKVGTYSVTASGLSGLGYSVGSVTSGSLTVGQKTLTVSGITASNKVYDGTTTATLGGTASITAIGSDVVTLGGTAAGSFADKNVGTAKTITITGNTISGTDASNYTLAQQTGLSVNITAKAITITADAVSKTYGNSDPSLTHTDSVALATGDSFTGSLSRASGENVGSYAISRNTLAISDGNSGNNYSVTYAGDNLSITKRNITLAATTATKVYGTVDPTLGVTISSGTLASTTITDTLADVTGTITRQSGSNVGSYNILLGSGSKAANYNITYNNANAAFSITAKQLILAGSTGITKIYDGTTNMPTGTTGYGSLVGVVSGDSVSVIGSPVYNSKDVATATTINQGSLLLSGASAGNYTLSWTNGSGTITPAALRITANNDARFVAQSDTSGYNGVSYSGFVNGETDAVLAGTLAIARSNSGTSIAGAYTGVIQASGLTSSNYNITYANGNYTIVPSSQLLVKVSNVNDTYGTATQYAISSIEYENGGTVYTLGASGNVSGSSVSINALNQVSISDGSSGTASFTIAPQGGTNSNAGFIKVGAYQLATSGTVTNNSGNFSDTITVIGAHQIDAKALTASASGGVSKTYDGTASMNGVNIDLAGRKTNDVVTVSGNGAFSDKNVATGNKSYTISGLLLSGVDSSNYYLSGGTSFSGTNGTISKANLTVAGLSASNKVYDATTTATLTGAAYITALSGDTVTIGGTAAGVFGDKNVGTGKSVTVSGVTIGGADAGNYNLIQQSGLTANITKADLIVSGLGASNKVYDATTTATLTGTATVTALLTDVVNIGGTAVGVFSDKNAGTGKAVTISGVTITGGTDAGNYNIVQQSGVTADITKANLTVTGLSASNKVYDATTAATITGTAVVSALSGDTVTVGGTAVGTFSDKDVGTGKSVTVSGITLGGTDANNYNVIQQTGVTANITKATLSVRANNDAKFVTQSDAVGYTGVSYSGFVGGEDTTQITTTGLTLSRSNAGTETAGTYTGVIVASGLTASNYQFNYVGGDYTIVASNQLLVRANNVSTTYGTAANYTIASAKYWDPTANSGTGGEISLSSITNNGSNNYTVNDGAGGVATFTLAPRSATYSSANKLKVGAYQLGTSGTVTENSQNFSDTITVVGAQQVNTKAVTASTANGVSKAYDGTMSTTGMSMSLSGTETNDAVGVSGIGAFSSKDAGTSLSYTVNNLALSGNDTSNYYLSGGNSFSGSNGVITKKVLSLSATKNYDGSTDLAGKVSIGGLVGNETLVYSGATANSADVADNNTNYIRNLVLADGTHGGLANNYALPTLNHTNAPTTITRGNNGGAGNNVVLPTIPVIPSPPPPPPPPNILPTPVTPVAPVVTPAAPVVTPAAPVVTPAAPVTPAPSAPTTVTPVANQNTNAAIGSANTAGGQAGGGQGGVSAQSSGDKTSFEGIKVGATTVGNEVRAIVIQSSSTSQTPVALLVTVKPNEGFSFTVPQSVVAGAVKADVDSGAKLEVVNIAQSDGKEMPSWLTFDKSNYNFKSENVPAGGLPLTVKMLVKNNDVTKTVEVIIRGNGK